ncbi:MAG TPA: signal peptide peptidase SppA [Treponema sp.]|jgi:protease-4|nr:signal peptide peptidase SppA [Treponema sp.]HBB41959.1 signal peptide peptidase SppA [Treponema sp.]HCA19165.1 signal peptide peptidase SppA [Treponema sp.]
MKKENNTGFIVFIVIIVLALIVTISKFAAPKTEVVSKPKTVSKPASIFNLRNHAEETKETHLPGQKYIARLYINGTIEESNSSYDQEWLMSTIDELENDKDNLGIILDIDSPGGTVYEADEIYLRLLKYAENRPVYAYFESLAASGGYYIGCAAEYIVANRNTMTGSIGVIAGRSIDLTGLMEKYGVKMETIHAGRNKIMGSINEPLTDEQRKIMQSLADECYDQFTDIVSTSRNLDIKTVRELADGRVYTAKQALDNKLIDKIGSFDTVYEDMCEREFDGNDFFVEEFTFVPDYNFYDYFRNAASSFVSPSASQLPQPLMDAIAPDIKYPAYFWHP